MKSSEKKKPTGPKSLQKYCNEIILALKELGGSGTPREVIDLITKKLKISEEELEVKHKSGVYKVDNDIAWARNYLVQSGFLDSSKRGVWGLTEKGLTANLNSEDIYKIFKSVHSKYTSKTKEDEYEIDKYKESESILVNKEEDNYKVLLINKIKSLSPSGFERLCQRLLRESGFQEVIITGKTGDGGIDGHGILEVNPLVSFKVIFQCKRYEGSVTPSQVRDFRGAMMGRADKGIILTTGRFTQDSKKEAIRDGVPPIQLVDGENLIEMFEKLGLGLKPKADYDIDEDFFKGFS